MNKDLQSLGNSEALIVEARAYLNALPQSQAEQGFLISRLMAQLSALQSDNDTLRAALEVISILRPSRPPDAITEKLYAEYTDAERAIFDRGENYGHSRAWESAATKAQEALSRRGRG